MRRKMRSAGREDNIDLLIALDYDFRSAVTVLERWLEQHHAKAKKEPAAPAPSHE